MTTPASIPEPDLLSAEQFLAIGHPGSCELVEGRVVTMSPTGARHGRIESFLVARLTEFVDAAGSGVVLAGEVGLFTRRKPDTVRGADIVFVSNERLGSDVPEGFLTVAPELIVEIASPSDHWREMRAKLEEYFAAGVERVWVVEPETRTVLVYRNALEAAKLTEVDTLRGEGKLAGFELPLSRLFGAR